MLTGKRWVFRLPNNLESKRKFGDRSVSSLQRISLLALFRMLLSFVFVFGKRIGTSRFILEARGVRVMRVFMVNSVAVCEFGHGVSWVCEGKSCDDIEASHNGRQRMDGWRERKDRHGRRRRRAELGKGVEERGKSQLKRPKYLFCFCSFYLYSGRLKL